MSVTSGFFNSKNGDRKYNAEQMSSLFDGIIRDGIFQHIGTSMMVTAGSGMEVIVGIGRAWFKHTWTLNDSLLPLVIDPAEVLFKRIDAVVLEVDNRENFRQNSIKVIKGTPGNSPERPVLIKENDRAQYALAYVEVGAAVASITQANITNMVGTGDTPFITAPLEKMNIDALVAQWQSQYTQWRDGLNTNAQNWRTEFEQLMNTWKTDITQNYDSWTNEKRQAFNNWFENVKGQLSGDVAVNLAERISALEQQTPDDDVLLNKKRTLTVQELNNPNYPKPYVASTNQGKQLGLPTDWAFIQYFRHEDNNGYGTQVAYKLDRNNQEGANSKLWTMKIRISNASVWGAWENVSTSIPKGHYPVADLNECNQDGTHYYFNSDTANRPPAHTDGIVSVYGYNVGTNEHQSLNPFIVQVAHSWWQESVFMRRGHNGEFGAWKNILDSNNSVFTVTGNSLHFNGGDKKVEVRHVDGISTHGMDGNLYLNFHNDSPVIFKVNGSYHTLQEVFQSASNGKNLCANALTGLGTPTSTTATWQTISDNIKKHKYKAGQVLSTNNYTIKGCGLEKIVQIANGSYPSPLYYCNRVLFGIIGSYYNDTQYYNEVSLTNIDTGVTTKKQISLNSSGDAMITSNPPYFVEPEGIVIIMATRYIGFIKYTGEIKRLMMNTESLFSTGSYLCVYNSTERLVGIPQKPWGNGGGISFISIDNPTGIVKSFDCNGYYFFHHCNKDNSLFAFKDNYLKKTSSNGATIWEKNIPNVKVYGASDNCILTNSGIYSKSTGLLISNNILSSGGYLQVDNGYIRLYNSEFIALLKQDTYDYFGFSDDGMYPIPDFKLGLPVGNSGYSSKHPFLKNGKYFHITTRHEDYMQKPDKLYIFSTDNKVTLK